MRDRGSDGTGVTPDSGRSGPRQGDATPAGSQRIEDHRPDGSTRHLDTFRRLGRRVAARADAWKATLLAWRAKMYATRLGRVGVKLAVALIGTLVVAVGVLLLPLPGPGWLIILTGLAILALEFHWARQLLTYTRAQLVKWTTLVRNGSWVVKLASAGGLMLVVGAALWLSYNMLR